jgi:hypothetical protein
MKPAAISENATLTLMYELMQFARRGLSDPAMKEEIQRKCGGVGGVDTSELLSGVSRSLEVLFPAMFADFLAENPELLNVQELESWASRRRLLMETKGPLM